MPLNPDGSLRYFTPTEIAAMELETTKVRTGEHPEETREIGQNTMRRSYFCKWESRYDVIELVCGQQAYQAVGGDGFPHISRTSPDVKWGQHPYAFDFYATKAERIVGQGQNQGEDANGMPFYPRARIDFLFENVPYTLAEDAAVIAGGRKEIIRYVWTSGTESGGDSVTGKGGFLRFRTAGGPPDGVPIPYSYPVVRPHTEWSLRWERVPYLAAAPGTRIDLFGRQGTYAGMINKVAFYNQPAGTVLFLGANFKLQRPQTIGTIASLVWTWSIEYRFVSTPYGHLALRYFDLAGGGAANGWYYAGTGALKTPATLADFESFVQGARDLNDLFIV